MAVKQVDGKTFQCATTDAQNTWTAANRIGNTMIVINETTKAISAYYYFDGTNWNTV